MYIGNWKLNVFIWCGKYIKMSLVIRLGYWVYVVKNLILYNCDFCCFGIVRLGYEN